ncbi:hypothetical protein C4D60_Mb06t13960 [Musa balbisiana]|uniref:AT-hook motif nuclear-localized protein n=1 Tax=Musa balbisiana TaxID=52838 RepID=A0A4S8IMX4_MUSBA|nr:hypothetical protein C4D60_Mb06t13960 [Musa balbisiana]
MGITVPPTEGAGLAMGMLGSGGSSGGEGDLFARKKRGRPRKYGPDGLGSGGSSGGEGDLFARKKRGRPRKYGPDGMALALSPTRSLPLALSSGVVGAMGITVPPTEGAGLAMGMLGSGGSSGGEGDLFARKKRGRPRKYGPDGMALALSPTRSLPLALSSGVVGAMGITVPPTEGAGLAMGMLGSGGSSGGEGDLFARKKRGRPRKYGPDGMALALSPTRSLPLALSSGVVGAMGITVPPTEGAGLAMGMLGSGGSSGGEGDLFARKKRGRPRKYGPDGMALALSPTRSLPLALSSGVVGAMGITVPPTEGAGLAMGMLGSGGSSGGEGDLFARKKRGRPRKYGPDGMALALSPTRSLPLALSSGVVGAMGITVPPTEGAVLS